VGVSESLKNWLLWAWGEFEKIGYIRRWGGFEKLVFVSVGEGMTNWLLWAWGRV
jgi:hypothetical protein